MRAPIRYIFALFVLMLVPFWNMYAVPLLTPFPKTISFEARLDSFDDFYDVEAQSFKGPIRSVAKIMTSNIEGTDGVRLLTHSFSVLDVIGNPIYEIERRYAIDPVTRAHVPFVGIPDREGYFFAPRNLRKGEAFTTWWVNYDGPAHMSFVQEDEIHGLRTFKYETRYEGVRIDQTNELERLPGVPEERGIELEPHLTMWIEPVTGRLVNFKDETVAYYYDRKSGKRLHPWNRFSNTFSEADVISRVTRIQAAKEKIVLYHLSGSALLILLSALIFSYPMYARRVREFVTNV